MLGFNLCSWCCDILQFLSFEVFMAVDLWFFGLWHHIGWQVPVFPRNILSQSFSTQKVYAVYSFQTLIHHYQTTHCHNSKRPQYICFKFVHQWTGPMCYYQDHLAIWLLIGSKIQFHLPLGMILNQLNPVQSSAAYFSSAHSALILPSPYLSSKWLFSKRNPLWNPLQISVLSSLECILTCLFWLL